MVQSSFVRTICVFTVVLTRIFHAEAFIDATIDEVTTSTIAFTWHGGGDIMISTSDGQNTLFPVATLLPQVEPESGERNITLEVNGKRYEFTNLTDGTQFDLILSDAKGLQRRLIFATTARCPLGWKGFRNSCYITESTILTGQEGASQGCMSLLPSAHLADPRTVEEYKFITSPRVLPNSNRIYWIGITVESTGKAVYTDKSGIAEEVKEFRIGEHSVQPFMKCVTLNPGHPMKWTQTQCIAQAYYVCEYPVPQPPTGVNVKFTSPTSTEINWIEPVSIYGSVFSTYSIKTRSGYPNGELSYSKTTTKDSGETHVVTELDDAHLYYVTVTADDENGGSSAVEDSIGFVTAPFPPLDLVYSQSFNSVELNWKKDSKSIGSDYNYSIQYDGGNDTQVVRTDELRYELVDLTPYTEYNISVDSLVFHQLGESLRETMSNPDESASVTFRTDVSPVFDFHVVDGTLHETGFSLAWEPALGRADQYHIEITAQSVESEIKTFEVAGNRTSYKITELESGETYTVSIETKIHKEKSETVRLEQTTRPPPPQQVFTQQPQTVDSAVFVISPPVSHQPAIFEGYRFVFQNVRMPGEIVHDFAKGPPDFVVQGLNPGSDYNVKIYTKSRNVLSFPPLNNTLSLAVSAPTNFRQTFRNETAIVMGWTPSQGEVTGYLVTCKNCSNNAEMLGIEDGNKILFGKLQPGKKYSFGIQARNDNRKNGLQSETVEYTTRTMPNAPIPTKVDDFNKTAATVSWSSVGGTKEGYVIEYSAVAGQISTTPLTNGSVYVEDLEGQEMTASLYDLVPGISYNGSVRTMVDDTYSSLAPIHFSTEPNSVEGVEKVDVGENWCQIRWTPGVGGYKSFTVDIKDVRIDESITDTEYNATLLKPATSYNFEVTTVAFNSRISSTVKQDVQTRPLKVSELDVYEITEDSFTVRWNPPRSIYDGFLIVLSGEDIEDAERVTEMTYASFNDVKPGTSYSLRVFSTYKETRSYYETQNVTLYPRTPYALISSGTTSMNLAVSWEKPQGRVGSYFVTWRPTNGGNQSEIDVMEESAVLSELTPGVSYNIGVYSRSEGDLKMSKTAANIILTTNEDFPGVPTSVIVESTDATSLHVGWGETTTPNGIVLWHIVRYRQIYPHPEPEFAFENVSTPSTDAIASDLESGAWYALSVRAYNSKGGGNWSEPLFERTLQSQPGPVANLQVEAEVLRSLTISWNVPQSPNGDIQSYSLFIQDQTGEEVAFVSFSRNPKAGPLSCFYEDDPVAFNIFSDFTPNNKTVEMPLFDSLCPVSHRVDDLLPYKDYLVSVQAHTDAGTGESASTIGATLEEKPSGPPRNITVEQVGPSSITLQWDPPEHPNGRLTYYANLYGEGEESRFDTNETSITIPDLMPFSKYAVVMSCGTKAGRSNDTKDFLLLNTTEDTADHPRNLSGQVMNSKSVYLTWKTPENPRGLVMEYEITIFDDKANEIFKVDTVPSFKSNETEMVDPPLNPITGLNENIPTAHPDILQSVLGSMIPQANGKEAVKYLVKGLRPFTMYTFVVKAVTSAGSGEPSDVSLRTAEDKPDSSPTNLQYINLTSTSVNLTWSKPETPNGDIVEYTVIYISNTGLRLKASETTYVVLENLRINSLYSVYVYSRTSMGEGPSSEQLQLYTDEDVPESPPLNPTYFNVTPTVVRIQWTPPLIPNGIIRFYTVYYRNDSGEFSYKSNTTTAFLTNLEVYGEYSAQIAASTKYGDGGQRSVHLYIRTGEGEPDTPPHNLTYTDLSPTSVELEWDAPAKPNGIIMNYEIVLETSDQTQNMSFQTPGTQTEYVLRYLTPHTTYIVYVRARTKHGDGGQVSALLEIQTKEDAPSTPPQNLMYENISSTEVEVAWNDPESPNGVVIFYSIYYKYMVEIVNSTQTTLRNLSPHSTYILRISASTSAGEGPNGTLYVYTEEDVPSSPPRELTYFQDSSTEITLSWLPPATPNGIIVEYLVRYFRNSNETNEDEYKITTNQTTAILSGLEKHSEYFATVAASTKHGDGGQKAGPIVFQTLEDAPSDPPQDLHVIAKSSTSLELSWKPPLTPNGEIQFYTIYLQEEEGDTTTEHVFGQTNFTITALKKYTWYSLYVTASTGLGDGNQRSSLFKIRTLEGAPNSGVKQLSAEAVKSTILLISWSPPTPITGNLSYSVAVRLAQSDELITDLKTLDNRLYIDNLEPYTDYIAAVIPWVLDFAGPETTATATTLEDRPGSPVRNLRTTSLTHSTALLEWNQTQKPNGVVISHLILLNGGNITREFEAQHPNNTTLGELLPLTTYTATVLAMTNVGAGPPAVVIFRTVSGVPEYPPSNVKVVDIDAHQATLSWGPPRISNGPITGYTIVYNKVDSDTFERIQSTEKSASVSDSVTKYTFTDFAAFTLYSVMIKSSTEHGDGPGSVPLQFTTAEDVPGPPILDCVVSGASEVIMIWDSPESPNGAILSYEVSYYGTSTPDRKVDFKLEKDDRESHVTDLLPHSEYIFEVRASTKSGIGDAASCRVTTQEGVAGAPKELRLIESTNSSLSLEWSKPDVMNGMFSHYEIFYQPGYHCSYNGEEMVKPLVGQLSCKITSIDASTTIRFLRSYYAFNVTVGAANGRGRGNLTDEVIFRTKPGVPSHPPTDVSAVAVSSTEVNVTWKEPWTLAGPTTYQARLYIDDDLVQVSDIASSESRFVLVSGLKEDTEYEAKVVAITSAGSLESHDSAFVPTLEDAPTDAPYNVTVKTLPGNSSSVLVEFLPPNDPNGAIYEYNIQYKFGKDGPITTINILDEDLPYTGEPLINHWVYVNNLLGGRTYYFRMNAATITGIGNWALGIGPWSNWTQPIVTPMSPPPMPTEQLKITVTTESDSKSTSTLKIDICIFSDVNGPLSSLTIIVAEEGGDLKQQPVHWFQAYYHNPSPPYLVLAIDEPSEYYCPSNANSSRKRRSVVNEPNLFVLGNDDSCSRTEKQYCNGPLKPDTSYRVKLRGVNNGGSTETEFSDPARTHITFLQANLYLIVGLLVGIVVLVLFISIVAHCLRRRLNGQSLNEPHGSAGSPNGASKRTKRMVGGDPSSEQNLSFVMEPTNAKGKKAITRPVIKSIFANHVSRMSSHNDKGFLSEFEEIESATPFGPKRIGSQPFNTAKNRYTDIIPYDHYRVKIEDISSIEGSGYINASYIPGTDSPEQYIATQAPLGHTANDFWRMIWETGSQKIVMLCNVDQEDHGSIARYWPSVSQTTYFGNLAVQTMREDRMAEWTVRTFSIAKRDKRRQVAQYHYTMWPLRGVPENPQPFARFLHATRSAISNSDRPVVVMCRSGSGRTAIFTALDSIVSSLAKESRVDPCGVVSELRNYRPFMIQTVAEYSFLHRCLAHIIDNCTSTSSVRSPTGDGVEETTMF